MAREYYTKLSITLETSSGEEIDEPNSVTTTLSSEMSDRSVHAWFKLFEQVLCGAGFHEDVIMAGGAHLAFNETRNVEAMRQVAYSLDLRLSEDLPDPDDDRITRIA